MVRYFSIRDYLYDLKVVLGDVDPALIVDAQDDAEEHLAEMVSDLLGSGECDSKKEAIRVACEMYGSPSIVAREYQKNDETKKKEKREKKKRSSFFGKMFGVYVDPKTYMNSLYLLLMFPLGVFYFTYLVTGITVGLGMVITIIGIPILILVFVSIFGLAWMHGRMTEVMLGIRMPAKRRRLKVQGTFTQKLKIMFKDARLYSSLLYLFLMFPLGIIYFTVIVTFFFTSLMLIITPLAGFIGSWIGGAYFIYNVGSGGFHIFLLISSFLLGIVMMTWTFHLVNIMAWIQGNLSRALLLKR